MTQMIPVPTRGCGRRKQGGLYLCTRFGDNGRPLSDFLLDPTRPIPAEIRATLSPLGLHPIHETTDTPDATRVVGCFDWIGSEHYPYFPCWFEEARRFGISRRIAAQEPLLRQLKPDGLLVFLHARGHLNNAAAFHAQRARLTCPRDLREHLEPDGVMRKQTCTSLLWEAMAPGIPAAPAAQNSEARAFAYRMPGDFSFTAYACPPSVTPDWQLAACLALPISYLHLEVVRDPAAGTHARVAELAATHCPGLAIEEVDA